MENTILQIHAKNVDHSFNEIKLILDVLLNEQRISTPVHAKLYKRLDTINENIPTIKTFARHITEHGSRNEQVNQASGKLETVVSYLIPGTHTYIIIK